MLVVLQSIKKILHARSHESFLSSARETQQAEVSTTTVKEQLTNTVAWLPIPFPRRRPQKIRS